MTFGEFIEIVKERFPELTERQQEQFRALDALYREWNAKINVISRKDIDQLYLHHVLHSLAVGAYMPLEGEVLDLGTGGGFPGIPLAILFPQVRFTLCDSIGKKVTVATAVARAIGLDNVQTVNCRAEELGQDYDWVVSRAVTSLDNFLPWVKGKYRKGVLYLKGGDIAEETATAMGRLKMPKGSIGTWDITQWLEDPYFAGKYVIHIRKW